jgi:hypothetical protein
MGDFSMEKSEMLLKSASIIKSAVLAGLIGASWVATSAPASAAVVCNRWGECWRTRTVYDYPPRIGIVVRSDDWWREHHRHYHWRTARYGRGYWRDGYWRRW